MKVAVCVHRVLDPEAQLKLADGGRLDAEGVSRMLDPVDGAALEAAVQFGESRDAEVTALSIGDEEGEEALRTALAQGAGRAVRITGIAPSSGSAAGAVLAAAAEQAGPFDLVLCGSRSSDHGSAAVGAAIAAGLGAAIVQNVVTIDEVDDSTATVQRRRDGGYREVVRVQLPAVLSTDALVAQPRFPTTQARLRANRAEIEALDGAALGVEGVAADAAGADDAVYRTPPPRLHGIAWPDPDMDARSRLRFLVQGGQLRSSTSTKTVTGSADEVAEALAAFLTERELVAGS